MCALIGLLLKEIPGTTTRPSSVTNDQEDIPKDKVPDTRQSLGTQLFSRLKFDYCDTNCTPEAPESKFNRPNATSDFKGAMYELGMEPLR